MKLMAREFIPAVGSVHDFGYGPEEELWGLYTRKIPKNTEIVTEILAEVQIPGKLYQLHAATFDGFTYTKLVKNGEEGGWYRHLGDDAISATLKLMFFKKDLWWSKGRNIVEIGWLVYSVSRENPGAHPAGCHIISDWGCYGQFLVPCLAFSKSYKAIRNVDPKEFTEENIAKLCEQLRAEFESAEYGFDRRACSDCGI